MVVRERERRNQGREEGGMEERSVASHVIYGQDRESQTGDTCVRSIALGDTEVVANDLTKGQERRLSRGFVRLTQRFFGYVRRVQAGEPRSGGLRSKVNIWSRCASRLSS